MTLSITTATARVANHSTGVTLTTASFSVNEHDLLFSCYETGGSFSSIADSQSGSWTLAKGNAAGGNDSFIHYRYITTAGSMTVTLTRAAGTHDASAQIYLVQGARANNPIGITGGADVAGPADPRTTTAFTSTLNGSTMLVSAEDYNSTNGSDTSSDLTITTSASTIAEANAVSGFKTLGAPGSQTFQLNFPGTSTASNLHWVAVEIIPASTIPVFQRFPNRIWRGRRR